MNIYNLCIKIECFFSNCLLDLCRNKLTDTIVFLDEIVWWGRKFTSELMASSNSDETGSGENSSGWYLERIFPMKVKLNVEQTCVSENKRNEKPSHSIETISRKLFWSIDKHLFSKRLVYKHVFWKHQQASHCFQQWKHNKASLWLFWYVIRNSIVRIFIN